MSVSTSTTRALEPRLDCSCEEDLSIPTTSWSSLLKNSTVNERYSSPTHMTFTRNVGGFRADSPLWTNINTFTWSVCSYQSLPRPILCTTRNSWPERADSAQPKQEISPPKSPISAPSENRCRNLHILNLLPPHFPTVTQNTPTPPLLT